MTNKNKLLQQANISDSDKLMLQTHAFIATRDRTPRSNLQIGSIVSVGNYYYLVCDILSDQALIKELAQTDDGRWYVSDRAKVKYLIELGEEVDLPDQYNAAASLFRRADQSTSEHAWNKWWHNE